MKMNHQIPIYIGKDAISRLAEYCAQQHISALTLVADQNTCRALGQAAGDALSAQGYDINTVVLTGDDVIADEHYIVQVMLHANPKVKVYLAVGSGTITDIVRFVSHRAGSSFISMPTAPSVDGYTSIGAPLVIERIKQTIITQPPIAVFADLPTLCAAPHRLIASGFGDILGKYTSLADWKLGHLIWDEEYDEAIARRAQQALQSCVEQVEGVGRATEEGVRRLIDGLIESGLCMLDFGKTAPASGSEHMVSHYWEMKLLQEDRPSLLHGAKVGVATVLMARTYDQVKQISRQQAAQLMDGVPLPDRSAEIRLIRQAYGPIADAIIAEQEPFLDIDEGRYKALKGRVLEHWGDIRELAAGVPSSEQVREMLRRAGGATEPAMLGLNDQDVAMGLRSAHYFRPRFNVAKLSRMLGIEAA
jgi:glycerol-1-phosphate dehydrogenase [NAD(P)+]